jgi:hypothetical protein
LCETDQCRKRERRQMETQNLCEWEKDRKNRPRPRARLSLDICQKKKNLKKNSQICPRIPRRRFEQRRGIRSVLGEDLVADVVVFGRYSVLCFALVFCKE